MSNLLGDHANRAARALGGTQTTTFAKIEIDATGAVTECDILDARSRKNAEFLKKRLRELVFPCFNEFGLTDNHLNFTVTFNNVENR